MQTYPMQGFYQSNRQTAFSRARGSAQVCRIALSVVRWRSKPMIRISQRFPKNSVRHWRAIESHPASADAAALLQPELVAGPYVLLADMVPVAMRGMSNPRVEAASRDRAGCSASS
jgi:hypothetical protein